MILQGRNLTQGLTGPDVATLHVELARLGYTVPPTEVLASQFGAGTLAAGVGHRAGQPLGQDVDDRVEPVELVAELCAGLAIGRGRCGHGEVSTSR